MMYKGLPEMLVKYQCRGIFKGGDFLLQPQDAISFVQDLANSGVLVLGCDLWKHVDERKEGIVSLLGAGDIIANELTETDGQRNAEILKNFIAHRLPEDAELISFYYDDLKVWDLVAEYAKCQ